MAYSLTVLRWLYLKAINKVTPEVQADLGQRVFPLYRYARHDFIHKQPIVLGNSEFEPNTFRSTQRFSLHKLDEAKQQPGSPTQSFATALWEWQQTYLLYNHRETQTRWWEITTIETLENWVLELYPPKRTMLRRADPKPHQREWHSLDLQENEELQMPAQYRPALDLPEIPGELIGDSKFGVQLPPYHPDLVDAKAYRDAALETLKDELDAYLSLVQKNHRHSLASRIPEFTRYTMEDAECLALHQVRGLNFSELEQTYRLHLSHAEKSTTVRGRRNTLRERSQRLAQLIDIPLRPNKKGRPKVSTD